MPKSTYVHIGALRTIRTFFLFVFTFSLSVCFAQHEKLKVGLTLSGGGAKGIAHIGILKAIDSAGLKVDYITGTSMGSIIGALYAVGYSGKQIEQIAKSTTWMKLFSNRPTLSDVGIDEKSEFDSYSVELPVEGKRLKIRTGIIEGQELWLKFGELFYPAYAISDFSKFSIPFKCVATDVETGNAVVLDQGEITTAIRASMAIPSVFTAIDYKETKLVDGGVVKNFPVSEVKKMGANYVIGVNLSRGLLKANQLNTAIEVLYQIGFYKDAETFQAERKLCNVLIEPDLKNYSAGSFSASDSLLDIGNKEGLKHFSTFKKLADSLKKADPSYHFIENRLPQNNNVILDDIEVNGLEKTTKTFVTGKLDLKKGESYAGKDFTTAIRKVFASRLYSRISYSLKPTSTDHATMTLNVSENPRTTFKAGIHYHTYSNVALIANLTTRNFIFDRSRSLIKLNISENFRALVEHKQNIGRRENNNLIVSLYHERFKLPIYSSSTFVLDQLYRSYYSHFDLRFQRLLNNSSLLGVATSLNYLALKPTLTSGLAYDGTNRYMESYIYFQHNTLDQKIFPKTGWDISLQAGLVHEQKLDATIFANGNNLVNLDTTYGGYGRAIIKIRNFIPLRRFTLINQFHSGYVTTPGNALVNFFSVGGLVDFIRNQIPFAGLAENQVNTYSIAMYQLGLRYEVYRDFFATVRANAAMYDFSQRSIDQLNKSNLLSGYSLSGGYNTGAGPLEIALIYSDQAKAFSGYVNLGFHF